MGNLHFWGTGVLQSDMGFLLQDSKIRCLLWMLLSYSLQCHCCFSWLVLFYFDLCCCVVFQTYVLVPSFWQNIMFKLFIYNRMPPHVHDDVTTFLNRHLPEWLFSQRSLLPGLPDLQIWLALLNFSGGVLWKVRFILVKCL